MAEDKLADHQLDQADRISDEIVWQSIGHQQSLQASAERKWQKAHGSLVQIVRHLDSDYYDACQKSGHSIEAFEDEALHHWIVMRIKVLQNRLTQAMRPDNSPALQSSLDDAIRKIELAQREEERLQGIIQGLRTENQQLATHLHTIQQMHRSANPTPSGDVEQVVELQYATEPEDVIKSEPEWMQEWRAARTFQKESAALILMGATGKALRPTLIHLLAKQLALSPSNSSLSETFNRLINLDASGGLIEFLYGLQQPGASTGGNHPDIVRLTERGRNAYQYLTGNQPVENEYDRLIRKHKSPEHTVLNIQAAEALVELGGYQIVEQAPDIQLPDGSLFIPDLVAQEPKTGEMIFVEVERDTNKDRSIRRRKWKNLVTATNGNIYVICDNISCERAIQVEINQALGDTRFNSHLTNLNSLRKGKRAQDGGIWLSVRRAR